jgi:hypothetical protein
MNFHSVIQNFVSFALHHYLHIVQAQILEKVKILLLLGVSLPFNGMQNPPVNIAQTCSNPALDQCLSICSSVSCCFDDQGSCYLSFGGTCKFYRMFCASTTPDRTPWPITVLRPFFNVFGCISVGAYPLIFGHRQLFYICHRRRGQYPNQHHGRHPTPEPITVRHSNHWLLYIILSVNLTWTFDSNDNEIALQPRPTPKPITPPPTAQPSNPPITPPARTGNTSASYIVDPPSNLNELCTIGEPPYFLVLQLQTPLHSKCILQSSLYASKMLLRNSFQLNCFAQNQVCRLYAACSLLYGGWRKAIYYTSQLFSSLTLYVQHFLNNACNCNNS